MPDGLHWALGTPRISLVIYAVSWAMVAACASVPKTTPASTPAGSAAAFIMTAGAVRNDMSIAGFVGAEVLPGERRIANGNPIAALSHVTGTGSTRVLLVGEPVGHWRIAADNDDAGLLAVADLIERHGFSDDAEWLRALIRTAASDRTTSIVEARPFGGGGTIQFEQSDELGVPIVLVVLELGP